MTLQNSSALMPFVLQDLLVGVNNLNKQLPEDASNGTEASSEQVFWRSHFTEQGDDTPELKVLPPGSHFVMGGVDQALSFWTRRLSISCPSLLREGLACRVVLGHPASL